MGRVVYSDDNKFQTNSYICYSTTDFFNSRGMDDDDDKTILRRLLACLTMQYKWQSKQSNCSNSDECHPT